MNMLRVYAAQTRLEGRATSLLGHWLETKIEAANYTRPYADWATLRDRASFIASTYLQKLVDDQTLTPDLERLTQLLRHGLLIRSDFPAQTIDVVDEKEGTIKMTLKEVAAIPLDWVVEFKFFIDTRTLMRLHMLVHQGVL